MKKLLLSALFLLMLVSFKKTNAQTFVPSSGSADTVSLPYTGTDDLFIENMLKSTSTSVVHLRWHVTASNFPSGPVNADGWSWVGFCDAHLCYPPTSTLAGTNYVWNYNDTFKTFHAVVNGASATVGTSAWATIHVEDTVSGDSRDLTFIATKTPTGVNTIVSDDDLTMWPNPALNSLNILFNPAAGVKYAAIFNMIGKDVANFRVIGNSARLDIDNLPPGVYMVRLLTADGQVAVTRRFTHQ